MFEELTDQQNSVIQEARERGFNVFYPVFPDRKTQARRTLDGALDYLQVLNSPPSED